MLDCDRLGVLSDIRTKTMCFQNHFYTWFMSNRKGTILESVIIIFTLLGKLSIMVPTNQRRIKTNRTSFLSGNRSVHHNMEQKTWRPLTPLIHVYVITTSITSGAGTANPSGNLSSLLDFSGVRVARCLVFCVMFCRSIFVLLSFSLF
jgi:hypothetical protein